MAVAANFSEVMERLEADFEASGEHTLTVSTGSTGKLYAQIRNGAPFDVLLAADERRPKLLEDDGRAVAGSRFTYAAGRLTLWSPDSERVCADGPSILRLGAFRNIAMANPVLAPYGSAAKETLEALGLFGKLRRRIVMGENIGQAHVLVATGNADLGFVALSYVLSPRNDAGGFTMGRAAGAVHADPSRRGAAQTRGREPVGRCISCLFEDGRGSGRDPAFWLRGRVTDA